MGISFYLYNAPQGHLGIHADGDESSAIGRPSAVKARIMQLYPQVNTWKKYKNDLIHPSFNYPISYSTFGINNCGSGNEYIDLSLMEHGDGYIHIIDVIRGSPKLVRELLEEFELLYVWEMQSCRLLDPYQYVGNWKPI